MAKRQGGATIETVCVVVLRTPLDIREWRSINLSEVLKIQKSFHSLQISDSIDIELLHCREFCLLIFAFSNESSQNVLAPLRTSVGMDGLRRPFSMFYNKCAEYPGATKHRRYVSETVWMLYGESAEIQKLTDECNADIKNVMKNADSVFTVTDLKLIDIGDDHPLWEVKKKALDLQHKIRQYRELFASFS